MSNFKTQIIRSKRKTLTLSVNLDAMLVVQAPRFIPKFIIDQFIKQKEDWIQKQIEKVSIRSISQKKYIEGEKFLYLGMQLNVVFGNFEEIRVEKESLLFPVAMRFKAKQFLENWYKKQARSLIIMQLNYYASQMNASYTGNVTFSDTSSQWGRCTYDNRLQFNWRLIMAPILVINYVVVHELAHTFEKNHSRMFWNTVKIYCPSYLRQRRWLKENGYLLKNL